MPESKNILRTSRNHSRTIGSIMSVVSRTVFCYIQNMSRSYNYKVT